MHAIIGSEVYNIIRFILTFSEEVEWRLMIM